MYQWGELAVAQQVYPKAASWDRMLQIGYNYLSNFYGDCGALTLSGANDCTEKELKAIMEIASRTGHNKLFATIVTYSEPLAQQQKELFVKWGWTVIHEGKSNRSEKKVDIVLFYHNPNCAKQGY